MKKLALFLMISIMLSACSFTDNSHVHSSVSDAQQPLSTTDATQTEGLNDTAANEALADTAKAEADKTASASETESCSFGNISAEALIQKYGQERIDSERSSYHDYMNAGAGQSIFGFSLKDTSYKDNNPYPEWDDYSHTGEDNGNGGKGELDDYSKAVNAVKEKRFNAVKNLSACAREQCRQLGGKDADIHDIGWFFCILPSFDAALQIAGRDDIADFESPVADAPLP